MMSKERLEFFKQYFENALIEAHKAQEVRFQSEALSDDVDKALEDRDYFLLLKLQGRQNFFSRKIVEALHRIKTGTFGICEECDGHIEENRLLARPMTTLCISCKEMEEKNEEHIPYHKRSHTLGKTLNNDSQVLDFQGEEVTAKKARILEIERRELAQNDLLDLA